MNKLSVNKWDNARRNAQAHIEHHEYHIAQLKRFIETGDRLAKDTPIEKSALPELLRELAEELNE